MNALFSLYSCKDDEDVAHVQELLTYLEKEHMDLKSNAICNLLYMILSLEITLLSPCLFSRNLLKYFNVFYNILLFHIVICQNRHIMKNCDNTTYTLLIDGAATAGDFDRVASIYYIYLSYT